MEKLPLEITTNILCALPIVSQLQCREVCKTWRDLLPKPKMGLLYEVSYRKALKLEAQFFFSEQNGDNNVDKQLRCLETLTFTRPSSIVFQSFVVGSCNGLVCYASLANRDVYSSRRTLVHTCEIQVYICNPVTGEHIQLPAINCIGSVSNPVIGFGYIRSSNDYNVVILGHNSSGRYVHVYTLRSGTDQWRSKWRKSENHPLFRLNDDLLLVGVFAGGALHWIDQHSIQPKTITFNLEYETFESLPSVPIVGHGFRHVGLMVLGGNLCMLDVVPSEHVTIWESSYTQKQCENVSHWVTKFSIVMEDYRWFGPSALSTCSDDTGLLWYNAVLSCYDPETDTFRKIEDNLKKIMGDCKPSVYTFNRATPHVNSLISLKVIMEERGRKMRHAYDETEE